MGRSRFAGACVRQRTDRAASQPPIYAMDNPPARPLEGSTRMTMKDVYFAKMSSKEIRSASESRWRQRQAGMDNPWASLRQAPRKAAPESKDAV